MSGSPPRYREPPSQALLVPHPLEGHPSPAQVRPRRPASLQTLAGPGDSSVRSGSHPVPPALLCPDIPKGATVPSPQPGGGWACSPDLGRSQGGVTAGTRAGGQRRRQLPGGTEAWPHLLLPLPGVSRRGRGQRRAPGRLGRSSTARGLEEVARPEPGARDPGRSPSNASPQPGGIRRAFTPRGAQSVREEVRWAGEPPQLLGCPPASLSWHTGTGGQG